MNKTNLIVIGVLVLVAVLGLWYFMSQPQVPAPAVVDEEVEGQNVTVPIPNEKANEADNAQNVITFTESGFAPSPLTIKVGETVKFVNNSESDFWVASAMHPTHKAYPGSDIDKCGTAEEDNIFDACGGIAPGGSWEFIFNEVGEWGYHDHLKANFFGKVIVE
ncbi:MAG: Plastocyanin [Candidatus Woesebacteria bacterium GW2011_GWC1_43_10b]|uniref:Plastocyanin n=1 Tax=Candidatus Woesebacteria bacterium GW2011_GWC1_43_10b TaxID=1618585 RepID=A0A0G1C3Q0_9BACT|nr:MAG: Plastocyanin [Candidatus Woesebacteria bacterium GW2011_GWC1_43_10b]